MKKIYIAIVLLAMSWSAGLYACRILGMLATNDKHFNATNSYSNVNSAFSHIRNQSSENPHGWGQIFYLPQNRTYEYIARGHVQASSDDAWDDYDLDENLDANAAIALAHIRYGTTGGTGIDDPHPFIFHDSQRNIDYSFVHNGTVDKDDVKALIELYDNELGCVWLNLHQPDTHGHGSYTTPTGWSNVVDSEIFFLWVMLNIELKEHNVYEGLKRALVLMGGLSSSFNESRNFILTDGQDLYAYRYTYDNTRQDHKLYYGYRQTPSTGIAYWIVMSSMPSSYTEDSTTSIECKFKLEQNELVYLPKFGREVLFQNFGNDSQTHVRQLHTNWNWEGFPVLSSNTLASYNLAPLTGYGVSNVYGVGNYNALYNSQNQTWSPDNYTLNDDNFFKINMAQQTPHISFANAFGVSGEMRDPEEAIISSNIVAGTKYWVNYSLLPSQSPVSAFGNLWNKVQKIEAENWTYINYSNYTKDGSVLLPSSQIRPLEFAKGYIITFRENITGGLAWNYPTEPARDVMNLKAPTEYFVPEQKANYDVIDVLNIPAGVTEIGVFQNGLCVGSVKVEESAEQILVYTDNTGKEETAFEFELLTEGLRSAIVTDYQTYDFKTEEYVPIPVIAGKSDYSIVKFDKPEGSGNNQAQSITVIGNYPNPFNPVTTISFYSPVSQNVKVEIFNLKGQMVKEIFKGTSTAGNNKVIWNGDDATGKNAASGVYMYKISTDKEAVHGKMLLMK